MHPSLYPVVYDRTIGKGWGSTTTTVLVAPEFETHESRSASKSFRWLPSDFSVDHHGKVTLASPYINNVHPTKHKQLYSVIPEILQRALPMFEWVLSGLIRPLLPMRIVTSGRHGRGDEETVDCIWKYGVPYPNSSSKEEYEDNPDEWFRKRKFNTPDAREEYDGDLEVMNDQISLKGRTLQVIVKLTNIILTPEKPHYPGGEWHVEGLHHQLFVPGRCQLNYSVPKECEMKISFPVSYT